MIGSIAQLCHIYLAFREGDSDLQKSDDVLVASGLIASNIRPEKSSCCRQWAWRLIKVKAIVRLPQKTQGRDDDGGSPAVKIMQKKLLCFTNIWSMYSLQHITSGSCILENICLLAYQNKGWWLYDLKNVRIHSNLWPPQLPPQLWVCAAHY